MKKFRLLLTLCLCGLLLVGNVQKRVIDDVNIATGFGMDKSDGQLHGSIMIPVFKADKSIGNFTFTANGKIPRDLVSEMQKKASQPIVGGSLDIALFGEDLAREGIIQILDVFLRDPTIGARLNLAVVDGKVDDIFKGNYGDRGNHEYLRQLLEQNMKVHNLPLTNLHFFLADFYEEGKDAYLPLLKKTQSDLVNIIGIALFKDEKLVDILHENKMFYFKLLVDKHTQGSVMVKEEHGGATVKSITSKRKIKLFKRNPYQFGVDIKIKGYLTEHQGVSFQKNELEGIEKQLEKQIVEECTMMIEDFQKKEIDPVGFGHFAQTRTRNFEFNKWEEKYKSAKFKVTADVDIVQIGVVK
ncbi:Ger(x)C family spore germination protein [Niallia oryzisoli]|uniref:Ger(X)C family spore germination protein n=1 Tax=Niallia oryzisoli TaxID=1737571 RepID=A0ABZ2CK23_9BACI